jgi:hypothetical protein
MKVEMKQQQEDYSRSQQDLLKRLEQLQQHNLSSDLRLLIQSVAAMSKEFSLKRIKQASADASISPVWGGRAVIRNASLLGNYRQP